MTTAAHQQRILAEIGRMLRRTDPRLASKSGMFSRLDQSPHRRGTPRSRAGLR